MYKPLPPYILPPKFSVQNSSVQVIVVLTDGWTVLCFDSHLRLLWESTVQDKHKTRFYFEEAAIAILPNVIESGDKGCVIVGGRQVPIVTEEEKK